MTPTNIKTAAAVALGFAWLLLVYFPPANAAGAADLIGAIKIGLAGLGVYHMGKPGASDA